MPKNSTSKRNTPLKKDMLKYLNILVKPDISHSKPTDLNKLKNPDATLISARLNEHFRKEIINAAGTTSEKLSKALEKSVIKLDYQDYKDSTISEALKNVLLEIKQNQSMVGEVVEIEKRLEEQPSRSVSDLLSLNVRLNQNPIFNSDIRKAKISEYARLAKLNNIDAEKLVSRNLDIDNLDQVTLTSA